MGPAVSGALAEGTRPSPASRPPYHGYLYRVLSAQGAHAEGGALDYRENGLLTRGFALIAWPASYEKSGVMTFLVNQNGVVFQKDLGSKTAKLASSMKGFDRAMAGSLWSSSPAREGEHAPPARTSPRSLSPPSLPAKLC